VDLRQHMDFREGYTLCKSTGASWFCNAKKADILDKRQK